MCMPENVHNYIEVLRRSEKNAVVSMATIVVVCHFGGKDKLV